MTICYHHDDNCDPQDESGLCNDLGFLAHLPELCDITFMVGQEKEPVCAVRAVLGKNISKYILEVYKMYIVIHQPLE